MKPNCADISNNLQSLQSLWDKFKAEAKTAKKTKHFLETDHLQHELETRIGLLNEMMPSSPQIEFDRWARKHNLTGNVRRIECRLYQRNGRRLLDGLTVRDIFVDSYAEDLLLFDEEFDVPLNQDSEAVKMLNLVRITVENLGLPKKATLEQIYTRAAQLGLELCPANTGPNLRHNVNFDHNTWTRTYIASRPLKFPRGLRFGTSGIFRLSHASEGDSAIGLEDVSDREWGSEDDLVFSLPWKKKSS
ncbi:hypothetical protein EPO05_00550 [Patescibacteria group bacterium]|nr:MAG: hypothetical protein EPO05_00550 [Patescibacteria group bacterium]